MMPWLPLSPQFLWWQAWRNHILNAQRHPDEAAGYCRAAMIAQSEYLIYTAFEMAKEKSQ